MENVSKVDRKYPLNKNLDRESIIDSRKSIFTQFIGFVDRRFRGYSSEIRSNRRIITIISHFFRMLLVFNFHSMSSRGFIDRNSRKCISSRVRASTIARIENNNKNVNAARSVRVGPFVSSLISFLARVEIARSDFHESWQTARLPSILYHHEDRSYHIVFF